MGKYDSSLTRVAPVFDRLIDIDKTGKLWASKLVHLAKYGHPNASSPKSVSKIVEYNWGTDEKVLNAPKSLLEWLVKNLGTTGSKKPTGQSETEKNRAKLFEKNSNTIELALSMINRTNNLSQKAWYILEGASQPDAYIITDNEIIIVEGKRTESSTTTKTSWMPIRDQMLRHLDATWDIRDNRKIYGLLIVENNDEYPFGISPKWKKAAESIYSSSVILKSLPHRDPETRNEIAKCFNGILTWQMICEEFDISSDRLPDTI